ncbi:hypothetical protein ACOMHN_032715 [Nucella lapillus]
MKGKKSKTKERKAKERKAKRPRGIAAPWHSGPVALWPRGIAGASPCIHREAPAMPRGHNATGPLCHGAAMPQGCYATGPLCHGAAMPLGRNATGPLCHGAAMPRAFYITSSC